MKSLVEIVEDVLIRVSDLASSLYPRRSASSSKADCTVSRFLFGHDCKEPHDEVHLSSDDIVRHLYVLGSTGSGKTNLLLRLIDHFVVNSQSVCVIDLRGDLVDRILSRIGNITAEDETHERLCLLDLRERQRIVGFNPLSGGGDPHTKALHVLGILRRQSESWGVQIEESLRNALVALAYAKLSLIDLERLLADRRFRRRVLNSCDDPQVLSFFSRYDQLSAEKQSQWIGAALNKVTPYLSIPIVRRVLGAKQSINLQSLLEFPGRIFLVALASHRLQGASMLLGSLLIAAIENAILARADRPESDRVRVYLVVDEFETMASESFETIIAEGRRFGLSLVLSHQNLTQLPAKLKDVIRNNVHSQVFFQTGVGDATALCSEIHGQGKRDAIKEAFLSLPVGEAFLVVRSQKARRVRTVKAVEPANTDAFELRRKVFERWASSGASEASAGDPVGQSEVRHVRKPKIG